MRERSRFENSLQEYNPFLNEQPSEASFEKVIRGEFMRAKWRSSKEGRFRINRWQSVTLTADEPCVTSTFTPSVRKTDTLKMSSAWENKNLKISYPQVQRAYTHLCKHLCKNTYMLIYMQEYIDVHAYICAYMYIYHIHACSHTYTCLQAYIFIYTNTHIHVCIYTRSYAHI